MSITADQAASDQTDADQADADQAAGTASATFGSGGSEPYAAALREDHSNVLFLHETRRGELAGSATMDVARWNSDADDTDLGLLRSVTGPVLDIGCGPGRMVRAAMDLGFTVLGLDVSPTAIEIATEAGLSVLERSVFDPLPAEGRWQTALLVDGNIGIGGDIRAMLARCLELLAPHGEIVVELNDDPDWERTYTGRLVDPQGRQSASFPWAEVGLNRLAAHTLDIGLELRQSWELDGRSFCRLAKTRR